MTNELSFKNITEDQYQRLDRLIEIYGEESLLEKFRSKAQVRFLFAEKPKVAVKWNGEMRKGEYARLPNRIHPRDPNSPKRHVSNKMRNKYPRVNKMLKSLGNR